MEEVTATPEVKPEPQPMTREQAVAAILARQLSSFDESDHAERLAIAKRKSTCGHAGNNPLFGMVFDNPSITYTLEELKAMVPLERDRLNYDWKRAEDDPKKTCGKLAKNMYGLLAIPRPKGSRKPHMNKHQQAIKSESLRIFRRLFAEAAEKLQAVCKGENIEYLGVPDASIPALGAKAAKLALQAVADKRRAKARRARRRQDHSRRVNAGLITISTSEKRYVNRGGQFGR
jgi:hypothetical protein